MTTGFALRMCALTAIVTEESVIPFASFARVFPVQGATARMSNIDFGPIGSASGTDLMIFLPHKFSI